MIFCISIYAKSILKKGNVNVKQGEKIGDLVAVNGKVKVDGSVYGVIYTLNSDVILGKSAKIYDTIYYTTWTIHILTFD